MQRTLTGIALAVGLIVATLAAGGGARLATQHIGEGAATHVVAVQHIGETPAVQHIGE